MKHATANRGLPAPTLLRFAALAAFLAAICVAFGMTAPGAKAETVGFTFKDGVINLGGEEEGIWAKIIDPSLDDPAATINAEITESGELSAATDKFFFPPKRITALETGNGLMPIVDASISIKAEGPLTGTFDQETGDAEINLPADVLINVYPTGSPVASGRCRINEFSLTLATTGDIADPGDATADPPRPAATYEAAPFASPSEEGAVLAPWAGLPTSKPEITGLVGETICTALDGMLGGPGAIWLSGSTGEDIVIPAPTKEPKLTTTPATSTTQTTADFAYEAGDDESSPVTGFECKLDAAAFADCSSGTQSFSGLSVGSHTFTVRAFNATGPGPEKAFNWTVTEEEQVCPPGTTGTPPACVEQPTGTARLAALKITPKNKGVKRGKKATITVKVRNAGNAVAKGTKVCVTAPKKLVSVKKCVNLGQIAAGKTKNAKFKVTVKKKAKKGKKAVVKFKATSNNAGSKSGKATVKVK